MDARTIRSFYFSKNTEIAECSRYLWTKVGSTPCNKNMIAVTKNSGAIKLPIQNKTGAVKSPGLHAQVLTL